MLSAEEQLERFIRESFKSQIEDIYTSIPAVVVEVVNDFKEQRVNVQPAIEIKMANGVVKSRPTILNVPVIMPSTSTSALTMPINKGDPVMLMFSMRAMETFNEGNGKPQPPNNSAIMHIKDAVAIIGLSPRKLAINNPNKRTYAHSTQDLVLAHNIGTSNEVEIRLKPDGSLIVNSRNKVTVNCDTAEVNADTSASVTTPQLTVDADNTDWTGNINLTGDINQTGSQTVSGDVTASGISLVNHTHQVTGIQTGGSSVVSQPPS